MRIYALELCSKYESRASLEQTDSDRSVRRITKILKMRLRHIHTYTQISEKSRRDRSLQLFRITWRLSDSVINILG